MSWLRDWLIATLNVDVCPPSWIKYLIIVVGSINGGYIFAMSGSWLEAVRWDIATMFVCWAITKTAEPIGLFAVKALLFIIP